MRRMMVAGTLSLAFVAAITTFARAQDNFGIAIYPGAKADTATADNVKKMMGADEATCFRTTDGLAKVVAFYKKQPNLAEIGTTEEGGMFKKKDDDKVSMTIQSPWMDMATGKMNKDTLISFVKAK